MGTRRSIIAAMRATSRDASARASSSPPRRRVASFHFQAPLLAKEDRVSPTEMILRYFEYGHLPQHLQEVSTPFCMLAQQVAKWGSGPETTTALRKLLEAKDCAVRARLHEAATLTQS